MRRSSYVRWLSLVCVGVLSCSTVSAQATPVQGPTLEELQHVGSTIADQAASIQDSLIERSIPLRTAQRSQPSLPLDAIGELLTIDREALDDEQAVVTDATIEPQGEPVLLAVNDDGSSDYRYLLALSTTRHWEVEESGDTPGDITTEELRPYIVTLSQSGAVIAVKDECGLTGVCANHSDSSLTTRSGDQSVQWRGSSSMSPGLNDYSPTAVPTETKVQNVVNYARSWAFRRNSQFPGYGANDCTNFASQSLLAGGWLMLDGPVNDIRSWGANVNDSSRSWRLAQVFHDHLLQVGRGTKLDRPSQLQPSDVLFVRWPGKSEIGHTAVVTGTKNGVALLTYHSSDTRDLSMTDFIRRANSQNGGATSTYYSIRTNLNVASMS